MKVHLAADKLHFTFGWKLFITNYAQTNIFFKYILFFNNWL